MKLTKKQIIAEHKKLHASLDRLLACWLSTKDVEEIVFNRKSFLQEPILELLQWSHQQTINPKCTKLYE